MEDEYADKISENAKSLGLDYKYRDLVVSLKGIDRGKKHKLIGF